MISNEIYALIYYSPRVNFTVDDDIEIIKMFDLLDATIPVLSCKYEMN